MGTPWGLIAEIGSHGAQNIGASGGSLFDYKGEKKRIREQQASLGRMEDISQSMYDDISGMYDPYSQAGLEALEGIRSGNFEYTMPEYDPSSAERFLDPSMAYQMEQVQDVLGARQAGMGDYLSSAGVQQSAEAARKMAETGYGRAQEMAYQDYLNRVNIDRQNIADRYNRLSNLTQIGYGATGAQAGARGALGQSLMGTEQTMGALKGQRAAMPYQLGGTLWKNMNTQASQDLQSIGNYLGAKGSYNPQAYQQPAFAQGGGQVASMPSGGGNQDLAMLIASGYNPSLANKTNGTSTFLSMGR